MKLSKVGMTAGQVLARCLRASAQQEPLFDHDTTHVGQESGWNFNFSSEAPHHFASAFGILQQWSNTFFPNGHSLVPCEIPPLTKLYHGRRDGDVPPSPEWVAFDIGMSYGIMGSSRNSHMLTYQTTRKVRCVYFDGESATLFGSGQLDSQMLHIWGNVSGPPRPGNGYQGLWEEYARATGLCDWLVEKGLGGPGWGYEGIIRMNAGFEMIWCNFSSPSARLISHLNITAPLLPEENEPDEQYTDRGADIEHTISTGDTNLEPTSYYLLPPTPTNTDKSTDPSDPPRPPVMRHDQWAREPFWSTQAWLWYLSATTHYGSSANGPGIGELRVKPVTCGFLSYYSPEFSSEATARAKEEQKTLNLTSSGLWPGVEDTEGRFDALTALTRRRRKHTLQDVSMNDAALMRADSERVLRDLLSDSPRICSGIDWSVMINDIVQANAGPLFNFAKTLKKYENITSSNTTVLRKWMTEVRDRTHAFLLPFLEYPDRSSDHLVWSPESHLFKETFSKCRFQYTRLLAPGEGFDLGPEETKLKLSVEAVTSGICSVLVDVGLAVEGVWETKFNLPSSKPAAFKPKSAMTKEVYRWIHGVEELMAWLGWAGEWVGCTTKCAWDESCFIPMWPMIPFGFGGGPGRGRRPGYGYGLPGYGRPGPSPYPGSPSNRTGEAPRRGFNPWQPDEHDLWEPQCVKSNYIIGGD